VIAGAPGPIGDPGRPGLQGATGYVLTGLFFRIVVLRVCCLQTKLQNAIPRVSRLQFRATLSILFAAYSL